MPTGTVRLHRVLRAPRRMSIAPSWTLTRWPNGYRRSASLAGSTIDADVGGSFRMSFTNFTTGEGHPFGGEYLERAGAERLRYTDKFADPKLPEVIPLEMRYVGWQDSLAQLAALVEPEITG